MLPRTLDRRLKRLDISAEMRPDRYALIALLRELPADAKLIRMGESLAGGTMTMVFQSSTWDLVSEGREIPCLNIMIDRNMVEAAENADSGEIAAYGRALAMKNRAPTGNGNPPSQTRCRCDIAYTGGHMPGCNVSLLRR